MHFARSAQEKAMGHPVGRNVTRRDFLRASVLAGAAAVLSSAVEGKSPQMANEDGTLREETGSRPNVVLIVTDDQGYADVGCFGGKGIKTPNLDRMATEGVKFTDFYSAACICSAARAAILTGCYPERVGNMVVLFPYTDIHPEWGGTGLNPNEVTIPKVLRGQGYATCCIGKWHLGDEPPFMPLDHGFDEYFGLPYSNDMCADGGGEWHRKQGFPPLPLYEGSDVVETDPDQSQLTRRYTRRAKDFIRRSAEKPFFLYLAHTMPHVPLHVWDRFKGSSERGLYGDVIQEIDWSVGEILNQLEALGIDDNTLVIFTSDNGPWLIQNENGGCAYPLRDGKMSVYEGGQRVPCLMRWPGRMPAGRVCSELASTIDLLPTFAGIAGTHPPKDRIIDGEDILPLMECRPGAETPHRAFFFGRRVVRCGRFKYFTKGAYKEVVQEPVTGRYTRMEMKEYDHSRLYDLQADVRETTNVEEAHPTAVSRMEELLDQFGRDLEENARPVGQADWRREGRTPGSSAVPH